MNQQQALQAYKNVATKTAAPGELVLLLFDGALRFVERAKAAFNQDDLSERNAGVNDNLQRAQAIIGELNQALDMERGGDLADRLRALYNYMDEKLQESNISKCLNSAEEVVGLLSGIRDAWSEMLNQAGGGVGLVAVAHK